MYAMKEVSFGWFIFVAFILLGAFLLEIGAFHWKTKKTLALFLWLGSLTGVSLLVLTDVGASYPLRTVFLQNTPMTTSVEQGMEVYLKYGCPNCHQLNGWGTPAGPEMAGIVSHRGEEWVREYLVNPGFRGVSSAMPNYASLGEDELARLLEFLSAVFILPK